MSKWRHLWWLLRLCLAVAVAAGLWFAAGQRELDERLRFAAAVGPMVLWALVEYVIAQWGAGATDGADENLPATAAQEVALIRRRLAQGFAPFRHGPRRLRRPYAIPWYLLLGPEGVGKSTIIGNSGLRLLGEPATAETMRGCAVIATEEAAFIDVASNYVASQDRGSATSAGWRALLGGLIERRPLLPLNGVILALSPADLVIADPLERDDLADGVRARLREIDARMGMRLPVYVLLTKLDLVPGFIEYFDRLDPEQRGQAWGFSFAHESANAGVAAVEGFVRAFDALLADLKNRQSDLLHRETDRRRTAMILGFPSQLAALAPVIATTLERIFMPDERSRRPLLRAVYLTSGRQDLLTIDRMLPSLAERFALPPNTALPPDLTVTEGELGWFIRRPLKESILREAGLVLTQRHPYRRRSITLGLAASFVIAVCAFVAFEFTPTFQAKAREVQQLIADIDRQKGVIGGGDMAAHVKLVDYLAKAERDLPEPNQALARLPLHLDPDLDHVERLHGAFDEARLKIYRRILLPPLVGQVQDRLADPKAGTGERTSALHAYRMLGGAEPPDAETIDPWLQLVAMQSLPGDHLAAERMRLVAFGLAMFMRGPHDVPLDHDLLAAGEARLSTPTRTGQ